MAFKGKGNTAVDWAIALGIVGLLFAVYPSNIKDKLKETVKK